MIVCPNCNHPNPDGAVQCEACYTPLPATSKCPNCGATVQSDAAFCGQCGYNLHSHAAAVATPVSTPTPVPPTIVPDAPVQIPPLVNPDPMIELLQPDPLGIAQTPPPVISNLPPTVVTTPPASPVPVVQEIEVPVPTPVVAPVPMVQEIEVPIPAPVVQEIQIPAPTPLVQEMEVPITVVEEAATEAPPAPTPIPHVSRTQLQQVVARLFHVQTNQEIELPQNISVVHLGKPNDHIPPDIDVSGFPNSEIVSRIHADIRVEGDACYIEDVGSSNGTYINNLPLLPGNRHRLRPGDRISLGKGDLVSFLFQIS